MPAKVSEIIEAVDSIAPFKLAFKGDNVGLQVGDEKAKVTRILLTLDVTSEVINEAIKEKAELVISHHPLIYQSLSSVTCLSPVGKNLLKLVRNDISLLITHTNLDRVRDGVSDTLAQTLGLNDIKPLARVEDYSLYKVVVFVPEPYLEKISLAMVEKGAGIIGNYTHCTFRTKGWGTFKPGAGAKPILGEASEINMVDEVRLEVTAPEEKLQDIIAAMVKAHPYEQVAYDIYQLENLVDGGLGRVGVLPKPHRLKEFVEIVKKRLEVTTLRYLGNPDRKVSKIAVCGGSGSNLIRTAKEEGAQVFVSGDIKYHAAVEARELGLAVIDAGHGATERVIIPKFATSLKKELEKERLDVTILASKVDTQPWNRHK